MARIHVLGLPHLDTIPSNSTCAYTQKTRRLCDMLTMRDHHVTLYGRTTNSAHVAEFVPCVDPDEFPSPAPNTVFNTFDPLSPIWLKFNATAIVELESRLEPHDLIAVTMGHSHSPITNAFPNHLSFESGVGYEGSYLPYRVFESRAWQHHTYGRQNINDGRFYDTVIPNAYSLSEFSPRLDDDGYLLFLGRHIDRKGIEIVRLLARDHRVITAGQDGPLDGCEYAGLVSGDDKSKLLAGARALIAPTLYIEPFGGVAVEAQLSGTPVIATPWGAFPETVEHLYTGFLCNTLRDFQSSIDLLDGLDHAYILDRAQSLYTTDWVSFSYHNYIEHLLTLHADGWYA